jgi:hypothetical protein
VPLSVHDEQLKRISGSSRDTWPESLRDLIDDNRIEVTSLTLRLADVDGTLRDEEFLGLRTGRMRQHVTVAQDAPNSQEEIDRIMEEGKLEYSLNTRLAEDLLETAAHLTRWARSGDRNFPVQVASSAPTSPSGRTHLTVTYSAVVDRLWHKEWPVVLELRPTNAREALEYEISYWRGLGDARRAELLEERLTQLPVDSQKTDVAKHGSPESSTAGEGLN